MRRLASLFDDLMEIKNKDLRDLPRMFIVKKIQQYNLFHDFSGLFQYYLLLLHRTNECVLMEIRFEKEYLRELYEKGQCSDKKHRFQPQIASKYRKTVDLLESTSVMEDLFRFRSLHFEALRGNKDGSYSVRVNDQYRLEFKLDLISKEPIVTLCTLTELSNHYK